MPVDILHAPKGRVRCYRVPELSSHGRVRQTLRTRLRPPGRYRPRGWELLTDWVPNLPLYEWGALVGNLLLRQGVNYGIGGMYLEFANVAAPGDTVTPPQLTRDADQGISYYNGLINSATNDYLRVPLVAGVLNVTDSVNFPKGNAPTFFAQSSGVQGVHGKPFSDANNSVVFGGALVAFVDPTDYTQDLVLSRFYLAGGSQQAKLPTSQVGLEWELQLT